MMGRIIQASKENHLTPVEKKPLRITQWRFIKVTPPNLQICKAYSVYLIRNINLFELHKINHRNKDAEFTFEYLRAALPCPRCGGKGTVDWIEKAAPTYASHSSNDVRRWGVMYLRNKKGPINVFEDYLKITTYTSTPGRRMGQAFCSDCHGCGIKLPTLSHEGETHYTKC